MIFDHIEQLKKQYTDKYVVADQSRPELQRFKGLTGAVKTVNMSGRALVEFDGYANIGWYDIDPAFLTVVPPPAPKPVESKKDKAAAPKAESPKNPPAAAKPIAESKAGAPAKPAAPAPAKAAPGGKGMSMEDILAAARNKGGAAPAGSAAPAAPVAKAAAPSAPAQAAKPAAAPAKAPPGGKGMSMEQILAMARGNKGATPAAVTAKAEAPSPTPVAEAPAPVEELVAEEAAAEPEVAAPAAGGKKSKKDEITSVADQVAYCRKVDAK